MQTKHKLTCDICQYEVEGKSERGARQGLGVHKRVAHGIMGKKGPQTKADKARALAEGVHSRGNPIQRRQWYEMVIAAKERKRQERAMQDLGRDMSLDEVRALSPEQKKVRQKLRQAAWWERKRAATNGHAQPKLDPPPAAPVLPVTQVRACKLSECPECGARFYVAKGNNEAVV